LLEASSDDLMPEQELPPGDLWTRIIDFEKLISNTKVAHSFDEDEKSFKYEASGSTALFQQIHKIYFNPDVAAKAIKTTSLTDSRMSEEELRKNQSWVEEVMTVLSIRAERALSRSENFAASSIESTASKIPKLS